jgi:hypothetical protein
MRRPYFVAGDRLLGFNAKAGSSSLVREIIRRYYPEHECGLTFDGNVRHHGCVSKLPEPDRPVVVVLRDPVDRFLSAMVQTGLDDVSAVLQELQTNAGHVESREGGGLLSEDVHFLPQARFCGEIQWFPIHRIGDAADELGVRRPLRLNASNPEKRPAITKAQAQEVRGFYCQDVALWEKVK